MVGGDIPRSFFSLPIVYNSRTSSIIPSGTPVQRPKGVITNRSSEQPDYTDTQALDYELELGFFVSKPVSQGQILKMQDAADHIFGFVLLNDWSARDIQKFEMAPLGPFHSKGKAQNNKQ